MQLDIREHLDYVALFACLDLHGQWMELWTRRPGQRYVSDNAILSMGSQGGRRFGRSPRLNNSASKLDVAQYRDEVTAVVDELYNNAVELLEGEWLKLEGLDSTVDAAGALLCALLPRFRFGYAN